MIKRRTRCLQIFKLGLGNRILVINKKGLPHQKNAKFF